jgi:hypothetical protein
MTLAGVDLVAGTTAPVASVAMVAQPPPTTPGKDQGGEGEDFGKSGPLGLLVVLVLLVAVAFLVRSMTKHLKRVPASFDDGEPAEPDGDRPDEEGGQERPA